MITRSRAEEWTIPQGGKTTVVETDVLWGNFQFLSVILPLMTGNKISLEVSEDMVNFYPLIAPDGKQMEIASNAAHIIETGRFKYVRLVSSASESAKRTIKVFGF